MQRSWTTLLGVAGLLICSGMAQPPRGGDAPPPRPADAAGDAATSGDVLRQRLQRRLDETRREQQRLERALAALDEGRPAPEATAELRPPDRREGERRPGGWRSARTDELGPEPDAPPPTPEAIRAFIGEHLPALAENLRTVESVAPDGAGRIVERLAPRITEVIVAQRRDERLGNLKLAELKIGARVIDAARQARETIGDASNLSESEENTLRTSLVELLSTQARIRDDVRLREIELLEAQAATMRAEVLANEEGRDDEIARLADRMIARIKRPRGSWDEGRERHRESPED